MSSTNARTGDGNQQVRIGGDNHAPVTVAGVLAVGGDVGGDITIQSTPNHEGETHTFNISKKVRIPISSTMIGVISGLISILGFATGLNSVKEYLTALRSSTFPAELLSYNNYLTHLLLPVLLITLGALGVRFFKFLRKNILWLPKSWILPGWAGIKNEKGRTFPYLLRLSLKCPNCTNQKLRFKRVPKEWVELYDTRTGRQMKRTVRKWGPMAVCPRNEEHSLDVDVSGNDFDQPLPR
ncbi:hypothetical protein [Actinomyces trachealis]|uniref:hypothetical protein n=1 Tax=Actinomyces trachealis TaxID=2763540 RepID=UPI001892C20A|nr:hypothetical protein [Actinomyces trachealis]